MLSSYDMWNFQTFYITFWTLKYYTVRCYQMTKRGLCMISMVKMDWKVQLEEELVLIRYWKLVIYSFCISLFALPLTSDSCCLSQPPLLLNRPIHLICLRLSLEQVWVDSLGQMLHSEHGVVLLLQKVKIYGESSSIFQIYCRIVIFCYLKFAAFFLA